LVLANVVSGSEPSSTNGLAAVFALSRVGFVFKLVVPKALAFPFGVTSMVASYVSAALLSLSLLSRVL
jgi:hypothetical protein